MPLGTNFKFRTIVSAVVLIAGASVSAKVSCAEACPVQIESVSQQPITTNAGTGVAAALKVTYRNSSNFPVRGIEFGIQAFDPESRFPGRPGKILALQTLAPGKEATMFWDATRFDKRNVSRPEYVLWPAVVVFGEGSQWHGSALECGFVAGKTLTSPGTTETATGTKPTATAEDKAAHQANGDPLAAYRDLINSGQASVVHVSSDPAGANVDVDMRLLGKTPLTIVLFRVPGQGAHSITVYKEGYSLAGKDIIPDGTTINVFERLTAINTH